MTINYNLISENGSLPFETRYVDSCISVNKGDHIVVNGKHFVVTEVKKYLTINCVDLIVRNIYVS